MTSAPESTWEALGSAGIYTAAATILVAILTAFFAATANRRKARRERYAEMVAGLAAWCELPYRVRRRSSNETGVISALVERMHTLQEQTVLHGAELAAEAPWLARRYEIALSTIKQTTAPFTAQAWEAQPLTGVEGMNLNGWGPVGLDKVVHCWRSELRWRFVWRWLFNPVRLAWQTIARWRSPS